MQVSYKAMHRFASFSSKTCEFLQVKYLTNRFLQVKHSTYTAHTSYPFVLQITHNSKLFYVENYQIYFFDGRRWPQSLIGLESRQKQTVSYIANQCPKNCAEDYFKNRLTVLVSIKITFVQIFTRYFQHLCSKQLE